MKSRLVHGLIITAACSWSLFAAPRPTAGDESSVKLLKGYVKRVSGDTLDYNCFNPLARTALLTRCTNGAMAIEWETEPIPPGQSGPFATFVWIVSYSTTTSSGDRSFDFSINNRKSFQIRTVKGRNDSLWSLKGQDGSELTFKFVREDLAKDANGYMYLKVPVADLKKGEPLLLRIVGEKANANDWFMTFMYDMRDRSVEIVPLPFLKRIDSKPHQIVFVGVNNLGNTGKAWVSVDHGRKLEKDLNLGFNEFEYPVAATDTARTISVAVAIDGAPPEIVKRVLKPVRKMTIYLLPHSHNDIGYTDVQSQVLKKQVQNIRDALELIRKTSAYPPEARFRWNVEVLWGVEAFLEQATEADRNEFIDAVRNGSMGLQGLYLNMLTGIMRPEEFYRLTECARRIREKYGITIRSAMMSDVPGMTWNMVPTLAQAGIEYFSCGPNGPYTGGDRTGYTNRSWADRPFYWVSPSGTEKILYWMTGFGYGSMFAGISAANASRLAYLKSFSTYTDWLERIGYPYDMIHMRHTINGDNGTVDPDLPDYVKAWNARYLSPTIVIATSEQLFEEFERKYSSVLPSFTGDMTPYWEDGAASTARELGMTRIASERLVQAEALYAILAPPQYDEPKVSDAWKNVLLFDEHTWGAWNSTSDPDNPSVIQQWKTKQQYAVDAFDQGQELFNRALSASAVPTTMSAFDVVNTHSWERTDLVVIPASQASKGDVVKNERGSPVLQQRLSNGDLAFLAQNVPPLGAKRYTLGKGKAPAKSSLRIQGTTVANDKYDITVDPQSGSISHFVIRGLNLDLVDARTSMGINEFLYVEGLDPREAQRTGTTSVTIKEQGPLLASLLVTSQAPGCNRLVREVRLVHGLDRVDLVNTIDKKMVRAAEAVHVAFPFNIPDGVVRIDLGFGVLRPEADQLAGACKDYYSAQRWVDVSNQYYGVLCTVQEAPLVQVGEMHSELPASRNVDWKRTQAPSSTVYSYVMNNYWYTNYKADQEGVSAYHYSLQPHGLYRQADAVRAGMERSQPLVVHPVKEGEPSHPSIFTVAPDDVIVSSIRPVRGGNGWVVRLYNAGGRPEEAVIHLPDQIKSVYRSSPFEEKGERLERIALPAHGIATVMIE